jgi:hypothetical protein
MTREAAQQLVSPSLVLPLSESYASCREAAAAPGRRPLLSPGASRRSSIPQTHHLHFPT